MSLIRSLVILIVVSLFAFIGCNRNTDPNSGNPTSPTGKMPSSEPQPNPDLPVVPEPEPPGPGGGKMN